MTTMREYSNAARTIVAGLRILRDHAKSAGLPVTVSDLIYHAESRIADEIPPWEPDSGPESGRFWSDVVPGDDVLAPDGAWYHVDAWSRTGEQVNVLIVVNGDKVPVGMPAGQAVMVRRGPEGQAVDVLRDAFPDVEVIRK